jgi:hypothetical protein
MLQLVINCYIANYQLAHKYDGWITATLINQAATAQSCKAIKDKKVSVRIQKICNMNKQITLLIYFIFTIQHA